VVVSTHLKHISQNGNLSAGRGENKKIFETTNQYMDGMGYEVGISRTVERKVTFITLIFFLRNPNSLPETNIVPEN